MKTKSMVSLVLAGTIAIGALGVFASSATKIKPGYAGIVYSLNGGIKEGILSQGMRFKLPFFEKVNQYSIATEQAYLSRDAKEGSKDDDSFNIPTADGKTVNVDLEFSYHFDAEMLPQTFTRFKGQDGSTIEATFIRGKIKAWASEASSKFSVIEIFGEKRADLNASVLNHVSAKFAEYGIAIDSINFSRIEVDSATAAAIQERINRQQELETEKINLEKAKLENQKAVEKAESDAKAAAAKAQGEADAILIKAQAEAEANDLLSKSLTDSILKDKELDARKEHGWVTINGASSVITDAR